MDDYEQQQLKKKMLTEGILRFYAIMQDRTYESVCDEYMGRPLPATDKFAYTVVNNRLYMATSMFVASILSDERPTYNVAGNSEILEEV